MQRIRSWGVLFPAAALLWALALPTAASVRASGRHDEPLWTASSLVYVAGAVVCHQRPERSVHLAGQPLPVCARCLGIYTAAAATAFGLLFVAAGSPGVRRTRDWSGGAARLRKFAVMAAVPTAATLAWEWTTGAVPSHLIRAVAGAPLGVFVAWVVMGATRPGAHSE